MKKLFSFLFLFIILNINAQTSKSKVKIKPKSVVRMEKCFCCSKPYTKGKGYFYYFEAGNWYFYEQWQDLLGVAIGQYSCSRKCAQDCPVQ